MPEINPATARMIDQYVGQLKAAASAQGRSQLAESTRVLDQQIADFDSTVEWITLVNRPATMITAPFVAGAWASFPSSFRDKYQAQITGFVDKAKEGDKVSQAVLLRARAILDENKIPLDGLPSFEWEDAEKAEK